MVLTIVSLNVQGLNVPQKHMKAIRYLPFLRADVVCLQETHFTQMSNPTLFHSSCPQVYMANASVKKRGVLIEFHKFARFICSLRIVDPEGRYLLLRDSLREQEITIVTYYAPNVDQVPFFSHLLQVMAHHQAGTGFLCGGL